MKRSPIQRAPSGKKRTPPRIPRSTKRAYRGSGPAPTDRQLHTVWAEIVKLKAGNECQMWGCGGMKCGGELNAHHIMKIGWRATRIDVENGLSCCYVHHIHYIHYDTTRAAVDILEIIGQERFDRLDAKHRQETKWSAQDRRDLYAALSEELRDLKEQAA